MLTVVIYDISEDKLRNKLASLCKDYGLEHVQFSAFSGPLSWNRREELFLRLKRACGRKEANVQVFAICEKDQALSKRHIFVPEKKDGEGE